MEIRTLTVEEETALHDGLNLAARFVAGRLPLSTDQVQEIYDVIVTGNLGSVEAQIAVGLAFGETIASKAGYEWVRVADEHGEETSLSPRGLRIVCHPVSILQKRIAQGETINIAELRDGIIDRIEARIAGGGIDNR